MEGGSGLISSGLGARPMTVRADRQKIDRLFQLFAGQTPDRSRTLFSSYSRATPPASREALYLTVRDSHICLVHPRQDTDRSFSCGTDPRRDAQQYNPYQSIILGNALSGVGSVRMLYNALIVFCERQEQVETTLVPN
jgi:hypothetical protein